MELTHGDICRLFGKTLDDARWVKFADRDEDQGLMLFIYDRITREAMP